MQNKKWAVLLIGTALLAATACAPTQNEHKEGSVSVNGAAGQANPEAAADPLKEKYRDSVFLGDSITEGLSFHDVLDEKNVLAGAGKTAEFAMMENDVGQLASRKPERVFIQLGSDDILWPTDDPQQYSLKHYAQLIDRIRAELPEASVTLLSVAPVTEEARQKEPRYARIEDYNEGLRQLAEQKNAGYFDLAPLVNEHAELYDSDGIHFQKAFYPILLHDLDRRSK